jgi:hypothetical protein
MDSSASFPQSLQARRFIHLAAFYSFFLTLGFCSPDDSLPRFANFIQRQMFVLRTYRTPTERWVNLFIMWLTSSTSATLGFNMLVSCDNFTKYTNFPF